MAKGYKRQNEKVIKNAFGRFMKSEETIIRIGMIQLLSDAVKTALELHDERHQAHITYGDTYGWMLVRNGKIVKIEVEAKGERVGDASQMLRSYAGKVPNTGWVGIVMAGLHPANFFKVSYEKGILENTIQITRQNFFQYFKKI